MKRVNIIFLIILCSLSSCSNEEDYTPSFRVNDKSVVFYLEGGSKTVVVISDGIDWKAEKPSEDDWFTLEYNSSSFTVTAEPYDGINFRNSFVRVTYADEPAQVVTVTQIGREELVFSVAPQLLEFLYDGTTLNDEISVTVNRSSWQYALSYDPAGDWLGVNKDENGLTLDPAEYSGTGEPRKVNVAISVEDKNAEDLVVEVVQYAESFETELELSEELITIDEKGTSTPLEIEIRTNLRLYEVGFKGNSVNWINLVNNNDKTFSLSIGVYSGETVRSAAIAVRVAGTEKIITIIQTPKDYKEELEVDPKYLRFNADGTYEENTVTVTTDHPFYNISLEDEEVDWVHLNNNPEDSRFSVTVDEYFDTTVDREAELVVTAGSLTATVIITQTKADDTGR